MTFKYPANPTNTVIESMIVGRKDKRDFIRMDISSEIDFCQSGSSVNFKGLTLDLSASGLSFETETPVAVGDTLAVVVNPGVDITPPLEITLSVTRVDKMDENLYQVAGANQQAID
jgi:hypothetical protein